MNRIMVTTKLVAAIAVVACAAFAAAQGGGGGGQGRGGGFGQRGFGGGNDQTGLQLLGRADVQRDVAVTAEQKDKITALQQEMRGGGFGAGGGGNRGGGGGGGGVGGGGGQGNFDQAAMREAMAKRNAEILDKLGKILDANQMKRLKEIRIQLAKNGAITHADVAKDLGITEAQKTKIADLQQKQREANMSLRQEGLGREEMMAAMQKNNEALNTEFGKLLTPEQAAKLKEMGGKEFKADPPQGGGGR